MHRIRTVAFLGASFVRTPMAFALGIFLVAGGFTSIDSVQADDRTEGVQEESRDGGRKASGSKSKPQDKGKPKADYDAAVAKMTEMVEAGEITREQMNQRLEQMKMRMSGEYEKRDPRSRADDKERAMRVAGMLMQLGKAVEAGEITAEQAMKRVMDAARRMGMDTAREEHAPADQRNARAEYAAAAEKMAAMVEAGEITREQMQERLDEMRRRMANADGADRKPSMTKAEYDEVAAKMLKMLEAGEITREQMQQRLDGMKRRMGPDAGSKRGMSKEEYDRAVDRMVEAVKAGQMTREQMQERLDGMEKAMKGEEAEAKKMTRADFDAAVEKMRKMVEDGEISREDMRKRLGEMRRMIADEAEEAEEEVRDPRRAYEEMKRRLDMAVEAGRLTQEQADERLAEFRRGLRR